MPHSYNAIYTHVVFATKDRTPQIDAVLEERLFPYVAGTLRELNGKLLNGNGVEDHLHLLISTPPTAPIAEIVGKVKGCSSRWIHETFPERARFEWQRGYGAFSVSHSQLGTVARYIERQKIHHANVSFRDEFMRLLNRHGIRATNDSCGRERLSPAAIPRLKPSPGPLRVVAELLPQAAHEDLKPGATPSCPLGRPASGSVAQYARVAGKRK